MTLRLIQFSASGGDIGFYIITACVFGFFAGMIVSRGLQMIWIFVQTFQEDRKTRLLTQYYNKHEQDNI
jgi:hypothetical protein